jgi:hypothetical protein
VAAGCKQISRHKCSLDVQQSAHLAFPEHVCPLLQLPQTFTLQRGTCTTGTISLRLSGHLLPLERF